MTPRASNNAVTGIGDGALRIRTTAPPADGKANQAIIRLLAKYLDVAPSTIILVRGQTHRNKQFLVKNAANRL